MKWVYRSVSPGKLVFYSTLCYTQTLSLSFCTCTKEYFNNKNGFNLTNGWESKYLKSQIFRVQQENFLYLPQNKRNVKILLKLSIFIRIFLFYLCQLFLFFFIRFYLKYWIVTTLYFLSAAHWVWAVILILTGCTLQNAKKL